MVSVFVAILCLGGLFDWSIAAIGMIMAVEIVALYYKKKPVYKKKITLVTCIPLFVLAFMLAGTLWAIDFAMNLFGVMRGIVVLMWMYLCFQMGEEEGSRILKKIPYIGAAMVLLGIISQIHESFANVFWQARRFGGFFQYANTCALFLLAGIVILVQKVTEVAEKNGTTTIKDANGNICKDNVIMLGTLLLLIAGIFLTGSRSVLLLLIVWGIYRAFTVKKLRLPVAVLLLFGLGGAYIYGTIAGDNQNIARIFTLTGTSSTLLGRLLYYIDGLSMTATQPFGLGYMGYYYIQPAVQTGVYTTRFIHNDILQILVDYGIVVFAAVLVYLVYQLIKGKQGKRKKELLIILLLASMVDFHMQYMSILMLAVLCLDLGEKKSIQKRKELRENYAFCAVAFFAFTYVFIACLACQFKHYPLALQLLPDYTEAQVGYLNECTDREEAVRVADSILVHNEYVAEAYHTKVYAAAMEGDYDAVLQNMDKSLALRRYDVERYKVYDALLSDMISFCEEADLPETEMFKQYRKALPNRLAMLEEITHPLAFLLRDKPVFSW